MHHVIGLNSHMTGRTNITSDALNYENKENRHIQYLYYIKKTSWTTINLNFIQHEL